MREIKFRAWDNENKTMAYSDDDKQEYGWFTDNDGCMICEHTELEKALNNIMQFTGLKDKNDKEIYEGDIVIMHQFLFDGTEYENEIKGVVVYNTDAIAYCLTKVNNDKIREDTLYNQEEFDQVEIPICMFYGLHDESWDIIGNIHDNPELLEEKVNE